MKISTFLVIAAVGSGFSAPARAQLASSSNEPAPGYSSLLNSNYANAEKEIRSANSAYDPASAINLGISLAKQGQRDQAAQQFRNVMMQENVEMVVADGQTIMSHDVAQRAIASLDHGVLSRR